jgi:hypothetical protein
LFCIKDQSSGIRLACSLQIVALDFFGFVNITAQFGGAIRDVNLNHADVCLFAGMSPTV